MFATFPLDRGRRHLSATIAACVIHGAGIGAAVMLAGAELKAAPVVDRDRGIDFHVPRPAVGSSTRAGGIESPDAPPRLPSVPEPLSLGTIPSIETGQTRVLPGFPASGALESVINVGDAGVRVDPASTLVVNDEPAVLLEPPVLDYPPVMRNVGLAGLVMLEFVVDSSGRVEPGSARVVETTHPAFTAAVLKALPDARFRPGRSGGQPVRQLVRQSFRFVQ